MSFLQEVSYGEQDAPVGRSTGGNPAYTGFKPDELFESLEQNARGKIERDRQAAFDSLHAVTRDPEGAVEAALYMTTPWDTDTKDFERRVYALNNMRRKRLLGGFGGSNRGYEELNSEEYDDDDEDYDVDYEVGDHYDNHNGSHAMKGRKIRARGAYADERSGNHMHKGRKHQGHYDEEDVNGRMKRDSKGRFAEQGEERSVRGADGRYRAARDARSGADFDASHRAAVFDVYASNKENLAKPVLLAIPRNASGFKAAEHTMIHEDVDADHFHYLAGFDDAAVQAAFPATDEHRYVHPLHLARAVLTDEILSLRTPYAMEADAAVGLPAPNLSKLAVPARVTASLSSLRAPLLDIAASHDDLNHVASLESVADRLQGFSADKAVGASMHLDPVQQRLMRLRGEVSAAPQANAVPKPSEMRLFHAEMQESHTPYKPALHGVAAAEGLKHLGASEQDALATQEALRAQTQKTLKAWGLDAVKMDAKGTGVGAGYSVQEYVFGSHPEAHPASYGAIATSRQAEGSRRSLPINGVLHAGSTIKFSKALDLQSPSGERVGVEPNQRLIVSAMMEPKKWVHVAEPLEVARTSESGTLTWTSRVHAPGEDKDSGLMISADASQKLGDATVRRLIHVVTPDSK